jgi:hypothetical protein
MKVGHSVELTIEEIRDAIAIRACEVFESKHPGVKLDRVSLMRGALQVFLLDTEAKPVEVATAAITWSS